MNRINFSRAEGFIVGLMFAICTSLAAIDGFNKWGTQMFDINIFITAVFIGFPVGWFFIKLLLEYFGVTSGYKADGFISKNIYFTAVAGFLFCLGSGLVFQENALSRITAPTVSNYESRTYDNRTGYRDSQANGEFMDGILGIFESGGESSDGEGLAILALIVFFVVLVLGSALLPNVWVVACFVNLAILLYLTILQCNEENLFNS